MMTMEGEKRFLAISFDDSVTRVTVCVVLCACVCAYLALWRTSADARVTLHAKTVGGKGSQEGMREADLSLSLSRHGGKP